MNKDCNIDYLITFRVPLSSYIPFFFITVCSIFTVANNTNSLLFISLFLYLFFNLKLYNQLIILFYLFILINYLINLFIQEQVH
jgi:hypothetical protein